MPTVNLSDQYIRSLKPTGERIDYFDDSLPGFGLRLSESGKKSWCVMYRFAGRFQRYTLGTFPILSLKEARQKARDALHDVQNGNNPAVTKMQAREAETFKTLVGEYMERHAKKEMRPRSRIEFQRIIDHDLIPYFGATRAKEITRADVNALLERKAITAPVQANRMRALLNMIFNWAIKKGEFGIDHNPVHLTDQPGGKESERDRVLSEGELRVIWKATEALRLDTKAIFRLLILTAQRSGEVRGMQWKELNPDYTWWTIPAERTKNGLTHRVPMSPQAVKIISDMAVLAEKKHASRNKRNRTEEPPSDFVFPGRKSGTCVQWIGKTREQITDATRIDFTPHDLRRTAATFMTGMKIPRLIVSMVLNHVEGGITKVYDRYLYDTEKREALEAWARKLTILVSDLREAINATS